MLIDLEADFGGFVVVVLQRAQPDPALAMPLVAGAAACILAGIAAIVWFRLQALRQLGDRSILSDHVFSAFFGNASVGIAVLDEHGAIVRANSILQAMTGFDEQSLVGMLYLDLVDHPEDGDVRERVVGALDRFGESRHLVLRRADGALVRARFVVTPAPAALSRKNSIIFVEEVGTEYPGGDPPDRTSRSRTVAPYGNAVRTSTTTGSNGGPNASGGDDGLIAGIHDEIRTPLAVILGSASLLRSAVPPDHSDLVTAIEASSQRLLETADALLCLVRIRYSQDASFVELFDARSVVAETVDAQRPAATAKGLELTCSIPPTPLPIESDRGVLIRILTQLLDNAVKFTEAGSVRVEAHSDGTTVEIVVSDTGSGFEDANGSKLFTPFYQASSGSRRRHRGVGLGLTLVRELAETLDGSVEAVGRPGEGATFTLRFPTNVALTRAA
jgi:PAS domain S-box-containing protein